MLLQHKSSFSRLPRQSSHCRRTNLSYTIPEGSARSASTTKDFPSIAPRGLDTTTHGDLQAIPMRAVPAREVAGVVAGVIVENRKPRLFHMLEAQEQFVHTVWLGYCLVWRHSCCETMDSKSTSSKTCTYARSRKQIFIAF